MHGQFLRHVSRRTLPSRRNTSCRIAFRPKNRSPMSIKLRRRCLSLPARIGGARENEKACATTLARLVDAVRPVRELIDHTEGWSPEFEPVLRTFLDAFDKAVPRWPNDDNDRDALERARICALPKPERPALETPDDLDWRVLTGTAPEPAQGRAPEDAVLASALQVSRIVKCANRTGLIKGLDGRAYLVSNASRPSALACGAAECRRPETLEGTGRERFTGGRRKRRPKSPKKPSEVARDDMRWRQVT